MRITLTGEKGFEGRDGYAFTATIKVDGKRVGTVTNDGNGGCNFYHFDCTPNGKPVAGAFTEAMRERQQLCKKAFEEAARLDAAELDIRTDRHEWQDTVIAALLQEAVYAKRAKAFFKKNPRLTHMVVVEEPFDEQFSDLLGCPQYDIARGNTVYGVRLRAGLARVVAAHPEARLTVYACHSGERLGVMQVSPAETAWAQRTGTSATPVTMSLDAAPEAVPV